MKCRVNSQMIGCSTSDGTRGGFVPSAKKSYKERKFLAEQQFGVQKFKNSVTLNSMYLNSSLLKLGSTLLALLFLNSCTFVDTTMRTLSYTTGAIGNTFDAGKSAVEFTATSVGYAAKAARSTIRLFEKKKAVRLERVGNSFYIRTNFNGQANGRLILDTGASTVQISHRIAKKLKLNLRKAKKIRCILADGSETHALKINIDSITLGRGLTVKNTPVLILNQEFEGSDDGLLGMSYLENFYFEIDSRNNLLIMKGIK